MLTAEQYLQPDVIQRVKRLDLRAKFIVEGFLAGLNESPYRGFSLEFSEHRRYTPGDDPKDLDWTAWAKTDRLYVKTYQAETGLAAYLLVDTSRSMAYAGPGGTMTKLQYATALRRLALAGHDLIVFQILDSAERHLDVAGPVILEDPETGAQVATDADTIRADYTERLEAFVRQYERTVRELGGDFVAMTTSTPFDKALGRFLAERKRRF